MRRANDVLDHRPKSLGIVAPSGGAIALAFLAAGIVQAFRLQQHRSLAIVWSEFFVIVAVAVGAGMLIRKWIAKRGFEPNKTFAVCTTQTGAVLVVALCFAAQMAARAFGYGDANEVIALLVLQYLAIYLAALGVLSGYERASFVISGFCVFFVCCTTARVEVMLLAGLFTVVALWSLLGLYWSRLDDKAIDGTSKMLSVRGSSIGVATILMALAVGGACFVPMSSARATLGGFMPFSGGEDGYGDDFARDGIGDGNMLTGGDNATTTGAVETDQFIEDHKPSLYDVITEEYNGPVIKKKKRSRAMSLDAITKHIHDLKQSEMSGKTFRTMRKTSKAKKVPLDDRSTKALFFVEGAVPARFSIANFQEFDGWDWHSVDVSQAAPRPPQITLQRRFGKPIFSLIQRDSEYLTGSRVHRLKLMRLDTASLPSAAFLDSWHIDRVDNRNFFNWNDQGQIRFDGDAIPSQTMIDMKSRVPNFHNLRELEDLVSFSDPFLRETRNSTQTQVAASPYLQIADDGSKEDLVAFAANAVKGVAPGWEQVEAIVDRVRQDFELTSDAIADEEAENSVGQFLKQRRGPSYMFATTAAMALRAAGYKTRLASGFVVRRSDYDAFANQSVVAQDNLHMWPEVCVDGQFWVPVEPTPGYPKPYNIETIWQRTVAAFFAILNWIYSNPVKSLVALVTCVFAYVFRLHFVTTGWLVWWWLVRVFRPSELLPVTRRLLDSRFWAAGVTRPTSSTLKHWYTMVDPGLPRRFFELWNVKNYSESPVQVGNDVMIASCQEQLQRLTIRKIKQFSRESRTGGSQ